MKLTPIHNFSKYSKSFFFLFVWLRRKQLQILKAKYESVKLNWLIEERKCSCLFAFQSSADDHTLIFREMSKGLVYFNEWNSIGTHFLRASWECFFFSFCFLRRRIEFFIFFIIATGMEVIFCLLSIRKIEFRAVPTKTLPLNPSRKSLVSSKKPYCVFSLSRLTLLKHTYTLLPQIPKANLFRFSSLLGRFQSFAEFFLQLVGPNLKKQSIPHALFSLIVPCVSILVCLAIFWMKSDEIIEKAKLCGKEEPKRVLVLGYNLNLRKSWVYLIFSITICERIKRNELPKILGGLNFSISRFFFFFF